MREAKEAGPLGKFFRFALAAVLVVGAFAVYWNFDTLRELRFDLSSVTDAFDDAADEVEDARRGDELETEAVEDTGIAGVRMETSLEGETPAAETPAEGAPPADVPRSETPAADAPAPDAPAPDAAAGEVAAAGPADAPAPAITERVEQPAPQVTAPAPAQAPAPTVAREEPRPVPPPEPEGPVAPESFGFGLETMRVSEADASARVLVLRDGGRRGVSLIRWWTTNGTAAAGSDFARLEPRTERFGSGEQNRTLLIPIVGDRSAEGPETFFVDIALDEGAEPEPIARIEIIITDDD